MAALRDVAPCSQVDTDRRFTGAYRLHHDGVIALIVDRDNIYMMQHPRSQPSSTLRISVLYISIYNVLECRGYVNFEVNNNKKTFQIMLHYADLASDFKKFFSGFINFLSARFRMSQASRPYIVITRYYV
jgi:hypothetical protein